MTAKLSDAGAVEPVSHAFRAEIVTDGDPSQRTFTTLTEPSLGLSAGRWEGAPVTLAIAAYPVTEVFEVISGAIELTGADGTVERIGPGQGGYVPKGWCGTWRTLEPTAKTFVILSDPSP